MFQGSEVSCAIIHCGSYVARKNVKLLDPKTRPGSGEQLDMIRESRQKKNIKKLFFLTMTCVFFGQSLTKCMEVAKTHHWRLKTWRIGLPAGFLCFGRRCRSVNRLQIDQIFTWWVIEAGEAGFLTHPVLWNHVAAWYSRGWTPTSSLAANIVKYEYIMDTCSEAISLPVFSTLVQRSQSHDSKNPRYFLHTVETQQTLATASCDTSVLHHRSKYHLSSTERHDKEMAVFGDLDLTAVLNSIERKEVSIYSKAGIHSY